MKAKIFFPVPGRSALQIGKVSPDKKKKKKRILLCCFTTYIALGIDKGIVTSLLAFILTAHSMMKALLHKSN